LAHCTATLVEHYEIQKANPATTSDIKKEIKVQLQSTLNLSMAGGKRDNCVLRTF